MARRFAQTEKIDVDVGVIGTGVNFGPGTLAVVLRRINNNATHTILSTHTNAAALCQYLYFTGGGNFLEWDYTGGNFTNATAVTLTASDEWALVVVCKAAGTATPRFHLFKWLTGAWQHTNGAGPLPNANAPGTNGVWRICEAPGESGEFDIAAVMYIPRELSDGEIERLVSGNWEQLDSIFLREFPSGSDQIEFGSDISRGDLRDKTLTGTSRSSVDDPPGFRFSARNRRS